MMKEEPKITERQIQSILDALRGLEYGSVQITVHDSQITQIDRTEKQRFSVVRKKLRAE
jgi:hypothetical protein